MEWVLVYFQNSLKKRILIIIMDKKLFIIDNFLTDNECNYYLNYLEENKENRAFSTVAQLKTLKIADLKTSSDIFNKFIEKSINLESGLENDIFVYSAIYNNNESFGIHRDTGSYYNSETKRMSKYTLIIYLTENFEDGETIFYDDNYKEIERIIPKKGKLVFFDMSILHKGNTVKIKENENENKIWIGIEIIGNIK